MEGRRTLWRARLPWLPIRLSILPRLQQHRPQRRHRSRLYQRLSLLRRLQRLARRAYRALHPPEPLRHYLPALNPPPTRVKQLLQLPALLISQLLLPTQP